MKKEVVGMIPHIERKNGHPTLTVGGRPFILLAGEVHNSDSSSPVYMEHIWDTAEQLGMNALLLPVCWDITEPEEGKFDFSVPQALIDQARERDMHIVFLWFGSWKNAECMYAPEWVKRDTRRFPRAQIEKGKNKSERLVTADSDMTAPYTTLSYLGEETMWADAKAFAAFTDFLREYDAGRQTVVAVQVENETGLLGAAREHSDEADALFAAPVPTEFAAHMTGKAPAEVENKSWSELFGDEAEELFSAYHIARFVNTVAEAGKKVYPLPMAVNCWLDRGDAPGFYPSGGPVSKLRRLWDLCAPAIDLFCPDIYVPQFMDVCDEYTRRGDALFVPECATHSYAAPRLLYSVGHYHAMCYSPFGFDDIGKPFTAQQSILFGVDVGDPALKTPQSVEKYAALCHALRKLMPELADAYGTKRLQAASAESDPTEGQMDFGSFCVKISFREADGVCLCLMLSDGDCVIVGNACDISIQSGNDEQPYLDLLSVEEQRFENGQWQSGRRLNGDETAQLVMDRPCLWRVRFFTYS